MGKGKCRMAMGNTNLMQTVSEIEPLFLSHCPCPCPTRPSPLALPHSCPSPLLPFPTLYFTKHGFFIHLSISVKNKLIKHIFFAFPFPTRRDPYRRRAFSIFRCFLMFLKTKSVVGKDRNSQKGTLATTHSPLTILLKEWGRASGEGPTPPSPLPHPFINFR